MKSVELLDQLFAANREVKRLIVGTSTASVPPEVLAALLERRDQVSEQIQRIIITDINATREQLEPAIASLDSRVTELKVLAATADEIRSAISIAKDIINIVGGILAL